MPTPPRGPRLGGSPAHERMILANLATALFRHGRVTTTLAKARRLRPFAERLVTKAKRGDLHARRQVLTAVRDKGVVHHLFTEIAPSYAERNGGYLRVTKIGMRRGDSAPLAVVELVEAGSGRSEPAGPARRPATSAAAAGPATAGPAATAADTSGQPADAADTAGAADAAQAEAAEAADADGTAEPAPVEAPADAEPAADGSAEAAGGDAATDDTDSAATGPGTEPSA